MKSSFRIFPLLVFTLFLFTAAWGETNAELCKKKYVVKDFITAYPICLEAAAKGDSDAQFNLGQLYYNGEGVKQDYAEAAAWFRKAAEQGYPAAEARLADMYFTGTGVPKDAAQVIAWTRRAANTETLKAKSLSATSTSSDGLASPRTIPKASSG